MYLRRSARRRLHVVTSVLLGCAVVLATQARGAIARTAPQQAQDTPVSQKPAASRTSPQGVEPQKQPGVVKQEQLPKAPPPVAPGYKAPSRPLPSPERVGVSSADQVPLTLEQAIGMSLASNNDISASRIDVEMTRLDLQAARGAYDPRLSSESYFEHRDTPVASVIGGGANGKVVQSEINGSLRFSGATPFFGGSYQIDLSSSRQTTTNLFSSLSPQFPSALSLSYTQPLWRGLRNDDMRRRIEIAKKNLALSDSQFRQRAIDVITRVEQAYWDLVFALRDLQVQLDAVKQAQTQVESNRRKVDQGVLAPIDVVAADTQVATFEQNVYTAQEGVTRAENTLKTLILPDRGADLWSRALLPVSPVTLEPPSAPLDRAIAVALANRPELEQLTTSAGINDINTRFYEDQTKPQIDLVGAYTSLGLAGEVANRGPNPFTASSLAVQDRVNQLSRLAGLPDLPPQTPSTLPGFLIGGAGQSVENLLGLNFPAARVGVRFSLPVGNRTAEANLGRSIAEGRRIKTQREQAEQLIEADVRNTMQAVRSAEARLAAAASARSSSEQQYESEKRRFDAGMSTVFLVLQRQTDLVAARGRELLAQTVLNKAIADYQRATGTTLEVNQVTIRTDGRDGSVANVNANETR